jgi:hypothetical protein
MRGPDLDVPSPAAVAASMVIGMLRPEDVPMWAAWWFVEGYDGDGVRTLAGLSGSDPREVRDALPAALADVAVEIPSMEEAVRFTYEQLAADLVAGRTSEEAVVAFVDRLAISTGYESAVFRQPVGELYGIDDEWGEGWGRAEAELRRHVREACERQLESR